MPAVELVKLTVSLGRPAEVGSPGGADEAPANAGPVIMLMYGNGAWAFMTAQLWLMSGSASASCTVIVAPRAP